MTMTAVVVKMLLALVALMFSVGLIEAIDPSITGDLWQQGLYVVFLALLVFWVMKYILRPADCP